MRDILEQVVLKNLRAEMLQFFSGDPSLTSPRHKNRGDKLFHGLDGAAAANLTAILERFIKCTDPAVRTYKDLFTSEEFAQYERVKRFGQEIVEIDGHYEWKHYKLPVKRFGNEVFLYHHGLEHLQTLARVNGKAVIDIGAFVGDSALIFAELFPQSPIWCFEPNAENFAHAQTTLGLNKLDTGKVRLVNAALGAHSGQGVMKGTSATSCLAFAEACGEPSVTVESLDNIVQANSLDVGLIKIDVEGSERQTLEGALHTISTQKPILLISIYHNYEQFFDIKPFLESLNLGYHFNFFWGVSGKINKEIMLLCEVR